MSNVIPLKPPISFKGIFGPSPIPEIVVDSYAKVVTMNKALEKLSGHTEEYHLGEKAFFLVPDDFQETADYLARLVLKRGGSVHGRIVPLLTLSGRIEEVLLYASPIFETWSKNTRITGGRATLLPIRSLNIPYGAYEPYGLIKQALWKHRGDKYLLQRVLTHLNLTSMVETNARIMHDIWLSINKASIAKYKK